MATGSIGVEVGVAVAVAVGVAVSVEVGSVVGVADGVGDRVAVMTEVAVGVGDRVSVVVKITVGVGVTIVVGVASDPGFLAVLPYTMGRKISPPAAWLFDTSKKSSPILQSIPIPVKHSFICTEVVRTASSIRFFNRNGAAAFWQLWLVRVIFMNVSLFTWLRSRVFYVKFP